LECGGKPRHPIGAAPMGTPPQRDTALDWLDLSLPLLPKYVNQSAVAASLCRRTPKLNAAPLGLGYLSDDLTKLAKAMFLV